jgi:hypothetical protein
VFGGSVSWTIAVGGIAALVGPFARALRRCRSVC